MTWILKVPLSYSLVFQTFQQPTLTCHVSHVSWQRGQRASSAFLRLGSAASCAKTVALVDGPCLQSVPRDNTLIMRQRHKPEIPEHIQTCSCSSSPSACAVGGDPNVLVVLIPSYSKNISEKIRKYGRSAFRIATMKLPPIWESGSVWKLGMPGKMKVYKNHADTFDLMCLVEMSLQHVHTEIQSCFLAVFVFLDHWEPHKHYFTCQALDNSQKDSVSG